MQYSVPMQRLFLPLSTKPIHGLSNLQYISVIFAKCYRSTACMFCLGQARQSPQYGA